MTRIAITTLAKVRGPYQTLRALWEHCDRADWLKWMADEAASRGVIARVEIPEDVSPDTVRARLGNPFHALNQGAIDKRRQAISCWVDDEGQLLVTFNERVH